jgi:ribosome-binding factor A
MNRRPKRVASLIRDTIGQILLTRLSDPRIDPARTSIVRVEVPDDLLTAKVYVSVIGEPADQRRTLRALKHAAGHVQELMMREISLRHTPILHFQIDTKLKKTMEILETIHKASEELRVKDDAQGAQERDGPPNCETPNGILPE